MERDASKKAESSCEVTDSGFNEESKDDEIDHWRQAKSSLYVRSPSYDKPAPSKKCSDGAQICLKTPDGDGNTFLHHAIMNEMEDYACKIIMVVEDGATLEMKNNFGMTPLVLAMEKKLHQVVESLLDSHVNIESINYQNTNNILHIAATNADHKMLELMLKRRGEGHSEILSELANQVNEKGLNPLHISMMNRDLTCMDLLIDFGADINAKDYRHGFTCLHYAVLSEDTDFVKSIIGRFQPELDIFSYAGQTPYDLADENDFDGMKAALDNAAAVSID